MTSHLLLLRLDRLLSTPPSPPPLCLHRVVNRHQLARPSDNVTVTVFGDDAGRLLLHASSLSCLHVAFLLSDKKEAVVVPPAVVMPTPSKRGRKSKQGMGRLAGVGGVLPPGSDALILAHLAAGGQVSSVGLTQL